MIEFRNPYHIEPPGALRQILAHPIDNSEAIELALFQEHRYASSIGTSGGVKMKGVSHLV